MRLTPLILCGLLAAGCGDNSSEPPPQRTDSGTEGADAMPSAFCLALSARATMCSDAFDATQCRNLDACYRSILRTEETEAIPACVTSRACGATVQSCLDDAAKKYASEAPVVAYAQACAAKDSACGGGLAASVCTSEFALLKESLRTRAEDCLTRECGLVAECYQAALQVAGCLR